MSGRSVVGLQPRPDSRHTADKNLLYQPPLPSWLKARPPSLPLTEQLPFPLPHHSLPEDAERTVVHSPCIFNQTQECHTEWRIGSAGGMYGTSSLPCTLAWLKTLVPSPDMECWFLLLLKNQNPLHGIPYMLGCSRAGRAAPSVSQGAVAS